MTEFVTKNNNFASIKLSPFFTLGGLYLCISFDVIDFLDKITRKQINKKKAIDISKAIQSIWKYAQEFLTKIQLNQSNQANKH